MLSDHDHAWLRESNARANAAYIDPSTIDPACYDPDRNPGARAWFKQEQHALLTLSRQYLELLDRYGVGWTELRTTSPGRIVYEDAAQIVAIPASYPADWPFPPKQ